MTIRALLFDLDDTLYGYAPCNEAGLVAAERVLSDASVELSEGEFRATHDRIRVELASELRGQAASHNRVLFFRRIVDRLVGPARGALALELFETYWGVFLETMQPSPAADRVLEELGASHALGLISNHTTDIQLRKLGALGLERHFPVVVTSEEAGVEKPDPRIFEQALKALGVGASETLMVGDSPTVDLRGAHGVGIRCVLSREFVTPEYRGGDPDGILTELGELPDWLQQA
jgi:HAD superfamily hydrolase (TIGR01549 family)